MKVSKLKSKSSWADAARAMPMLLAAMIAACSSAQNQPPASATANPAPAIEPSEPLPRVVTDLSSLSAEATLPAPALSGPATRTARQPQAPGATAPGAPSANSAAALQRLFLDQPDSDRFGGTSATPAHEKLLNEKAAQFSEFSRTLLHQVATAAQELERTEIPTATLPEDLEPAVITATMDKQGKLVELVLERHSGSGVVDRLMIKACKRGLWTSNPPPAAQIGGEYRIRIEGRLKNFKTTDSKHWTFETHVGLALL